MKRSYVIPFVTVLLSLLFILTYLLTGKTNPSDIQTLSDLQEKDKLRFMSSWAGYDTNALPLKDVLNDFDMDNEGIEIMDESMAGEDFLFNLKADFATGNEPDVFGLWPGSDVNLLVEQGRIADLTDVLLNDPEWSRQFQTSTWKYVIIDDRIYGVPFEIIYEALFINQDLFDRYNMDVPSTYDELLETVITFREHDIVPIAFNTTPEGSFIYQNLVMMFGGKSGVESPFDHKGGLKSNFIEAMKAMKELYDLGAFPEDAFYIDDKTRNDLFMNKEAAMIVQGSWFIGEQGVDPNDTSVSIIPFPSQTDYRASAYGRRRDYDIIYGCGNGVFHMSQKAWDNEDSREEALSLLKHLTSIESAIRFQSSGGFISNIKIPKERHESSHLYTQAQELIGEANALVGPTDSFIDRVVWEDILVGQFDGLLRGDVSAESIAEAVAAEMEGQNP